MKSKRGEQMRRAAVFKMKELIFAKNDIVYAGSIVLKLATRAIFKDL